MSLPFRLKAPTPDDSVSLNSVNSSGGGAGGGILGIGGDSERPSPNRFGSGDAVALARLIEGELLGFTLGRIIVGLKAITPGVGADAGKDKAGGGVGDELNFRGGEKGS